MLTHTTVFTATVTAGTFVTYTWDFADASPPATGQTVTHTAAGVYTVTAQNPLSQTNAVTVVEVRGPIQEVYVPAVRK